MVAGPAGSRVKERALNTDLLKEILNIPKNHELRSGDGLMCITTGESTWSFYEKNAVGEMVASYWVVETNDFAGSGSITWTRTERNVP
ncbi:hypothetical protein D3C78_1742770 [compost metagenome]